MTKKCCFVKVVKVISQKKNGTHTQQEGFFHNTATTAKINSKYKNNK